MYPILSLNKLYNKCRLVTNEINTFDLNTIEIKLEYIQTDTLFFEDFYICHDFYFLYKDNKFYTSHTIKQNDTDEIIIIESYSHTYINQIIQLSSQMNIIEFLFSIHQSSVSDISDSLNSIKI
jgi:hypothetical protein